MICITAPVGFSYHSGDKKCHVPYDSQTSRGTLLNVEGTTQQGYTAYFMEHHTPPDMTIVASISGEIYWREAVDDADDNADLSGINSLEDCYTA